MSFEKKLVQASLSIEEKKSMIQSHSSLSIQKQCELLDLSCSTYYYQPTPEQSTDQAIMKLIDEEYTRHSFYGVRRITQWICIVHPSGTRKPQTNRSFDAYHGIERNSSNAIYESSQQREYNLSLFATEGSYSVFQPGLVLGLFRSISYSDILYIFTVYVNS